MPSEPLSFRAKCGCFQWIFINFMYRRTLAIVVIPTLRLRTKHAGVLAGLLLIQVFYMDLLQRCGDVELNPGPGPEEEKRTTSLRQTKLRSASTSAVSPKVRTVPPTAGREPTMSDMMKLMSEVTGSLDALNAKMDSVMDEVKQIGDDYMALRGQTDELREEVGALREENLNLRQDNTDLKIEIDSVNKKVDDLEGRSKRNNLIFYGLMKFDGETSDQCAGLLEDLITDKL
eukprot:TRINITY_DN15869_c0_g1_i3.p1 TRINITY_DN15869_c0_g1~~TRINITY_DN15869_c0_g1_i3.p1  ORF type:complete len:231 (-),score=55.02 TRINITY_DN15869_c0_g1_i3:857-1549(-)